MGILALGADERVAGVTFTADTLNVTMKDGRTITVPLTWYPRLLQATPKQRKHWKVSGGGYAFIGLNLTKTSVQRVCFAELPLPRSKPQEKKCARLLSQAAQVEQQGRGKSRRARRILIWFVSQPRPPFFVFIR
jgi:hypothetical protein